MDDELRARLDAIEKKVDAAAHAAEKVRTYLWWTGVITIALIVLPTIGLFFALPSFLSTYNSPSMQQLLQ